MSMSKLAGGGGGAAGWADIPRDLLESVLGRLPVPDRLRFPAVCTAWHSASSAAARRRLPAAPLSPWLMLPFNPTARRRSGGGGGGGGDGNARFSEARFLSLAEGRAYAIRQPAAPAVADRVCVGSSPDGWLVAADACSELRLLNPVTGAQVRLPSVATLPFVGANLGADGRVASYDLRCCFADGGGCGGDEAAALIPPETVPADRLRFEVFEKAVVVSPPRRTTTTTPPPASEWTGYAVLLICHPLSRLAVARAGDTKWTLLDTPARCWVDAVPAATAAADVPVVYAMDAAGRVEAWDMDTAAATPPPATSRAIAPPCCCCSSRGCAMSAACRRYLVELAPGHLLQVHRVRGAAHAAYGGWEPRPERVEYTTTAVELFEWKAAGAAAGEPSELRPWAPVDGKDAGRVLAGRALFLGKNASLCVPADGAGGGLKGNCVYFTDDGPWSEERCREVAPDVGVMDLAGGSYRLPRGAVRDLLWKWPPPVWVFPSLAG